MLNFIFLIMPGLLAFFLLYEKKLAGQSLNKMTLGNIMKMMRDGILMILMVNIIGLFFGKKILHGGETFVSGQLAPQLLSLSYLVIITGLALVIGLASRFIQGNFTIYFSKEKVNEEPMKGEKPDEK